MTADGARLVANPALCDGHGICVLRSPELLTLDAWGFVGVEATEALFGRDLRRARSAVAACPERALSLVDVEGAGTGLRPRADSSTWNLLARPRGRRRAAPDADRPRAC
jgi:ferredoxin